MSIGGGVKSSRSKDLQDLGSLAAKQLCSLEDYAFPSTNGRGLKISLSKAKVRFSGEGSDLSGDSKFAPSPTSATQTSLRASVSSLQGEVYSKQSVISKQGTVNSSLRYFTIRHPEHPVRHSELVSESSHSDFLGNIFNANRNNITIVRSRNKFGMTLKKPAFTLAEVLITLGIIGVVAAMTLPTLISNYKKTEVVNKLKVVYSLVEQAYRLSTIDNGYFNEWQIPESAKEYAEKYWLPYFNGATICSTYSECGYKSSTPYYKADGTSATTLIDNDRYRLPLKLKNGMYVLFSVASGGAYSSVIVVDINGSNLPNKLGYDVFEFQITDKGVATTNSDKSMDELKQNCGIGGYTCFTLIYNNGWEIPKDYPIKF